MLRLCLAAAAALWLPAWGGPTADDGAARYELGMIYWSGCGVAPDCEKAESWFRGAAELGHAAAQSKLGLLYAVGCDPVEDDERAAVEWFRKAAEGGDADAQYEVAIMYADGSYEDVGVPEDPSEALNWYRKAARQGQVGGLFALYDHHRQADGAEDTAAALVYLRRAAEQGHLPALLELSRLYSRGDLVDEDFDESLRWLHEFAEQGEILWDTRRREWILPLRREAAQSAEVGLAEAYRSLSRCGFREESEVAAWYLEAAERGVVLAQYEIGLRYSRGVGVPQDESAALFWLRKASEGGHADAAWLVGLKYFLGYGAQRDFAEAARWFRRGAQRQSAHAQHLLASMFELGLGVEQDDSQAFMWRWIACDLGRYTCKEAERIGQRLSEDERARSEQMARSWRPEK